MIKEALLLFSALLVLDTADAQLLTGIGDETSHSVSATGSSTQGGQVYDTDLYTGTTSVSIPIYSYKIDDLDLGVALSYSTTGVKVDQIASSAGMGWNISAASYIERVPYGLEDEVCVCATDGPPYNNAVRGAWHAGYGSDQNIPEAQDNDRFILSLAGRSFEFGIDLVNWTHSTTTNPNHLKWQTVPRSDIKIELIFLGSPPINHPINSGSTLIKTSNNYSEYYFRITDEKGNVFIFNKPDVEFKTVKNPITNGIYAYAVNEKWWPSTITSNTGAVVEYVYNTTYVDYPISRSEKVIEQFPYSGSGSGGGPIWTSPGNYPAISTEYIKLKSDLQQLLKIKYPDGSAVDFVYSSTVRRDLLGDNTLTPLISIDVTKGYDGNRNKVSYSCNQSYLYTGYTAGFVSLDNTSSSDPLQYRLFLNSIDKTVNNNTNNTERYYTFTYNESYLPPRLSPSQDFYGYFNGATPVEPPGQLNLTSSISPVWALPLHRFTSTDQYHNGIDFLYGTDKSPNFTHMQHGVLTKVKNALGGEFQIYYDQHNLTSPVHASSTQNTNLSDYYNSVAVNVNKYDGLRTQKIVYRDGATSDNDKTTEYAYENGFRFYTKLYYWYPYLKGESGNDVQTYWFNSPVHMTDYYHGSNHGYSNVTVTEIGYNSAVLSKEEYHFTNINYELDDPALSGGVYGWPKLKDQKVSVDRTTIPSVMRKTEMGLCLDVKHFVGTNPNPDTKVVNEYMRRPDYWPIGTTPIELAHSLSLNAYFSYYFTGTSINSYVQVFLPTPISGVLNSYNLFEGSTFVLKKVTTTNYSGATQMQTVQENEYNGYANITKLKWTDSKGEQYYKAFTYNTSTTVPVQFQTSSQLCKGTGASTDVVLSHLKIDAETSMPFRVKKISSLKTDNGVLASSLTVTPDIETTVRDDKQNPLEFKYKDGIKYSAQMWDTRINERTAVVDNARYADVAYTSFEGFSGTTTNNSYDFGHCTFTPADVVLASSTIKATTGRYVYKLKGSANSFELTTSTDKSYIITFWCDLTTVGLNVTYGGSGVTPTLARTVGNRNLYVLRIPATSSSPSLAVIGYVVIQSAYNYNGAGYLDEVRMHPPDASMVTTTYDPLFGISSQCDARNNIIYTEYDENGRASITRDIKGAIISQTKTTIQGPNTNP